MAFTLFLVMSLTLVVKIHDQVLKGHSISSKILSSHMIQKSYHFTGSDLIPACPFSPPTLPCLFPFIQLCLFPTLLLYCHCWVATQALNSLFSLRGLLRISTKSSSLMWMLSSATDLQNVVFCKLSLQLICNWWWQSRTSQRLSLLEFLHTKSLPWWVVNVKRAHTSPFYKMSIGSWETHSFVPC